MADNPYPVKPANELVVKEPGTSGEIVRQERLKEFAKIRDQYLKWRSTYYAAYDNVKDLLQNGADIQTGRLGVKQGVKYVRRRSYKDDIIALKGETYQIRLLEATAPHAEFYWRLVTPKGKK